MLVALVVAIGLAPAAVAGPLVLAAATAVIGQPPPPVDLKLWHGFGPALWISAGAIIGGMLLLRLHARAAGLWARGLRIQGKQVFDGALEGFDRSAKRLTRIVHDGSLQRQVAWLLGATLVVGVAGFAATTYGPGDRPRLSAPPVASLAFLILAIAAGWVVARHRQRFEALIFTSVIGLIIAAAFVYLSAPDLAFTQITVDVVTVLLLLLTLNLLPKETPRESSNGRRLRDGVLAAAGGCALGAATWAVLTRSADPISAFHWETPTRAGAGGTS